MDKKLKKSDQHLDETLAVDIAGLHLRNPTMLASGFLGISQDIFNRLYLSGAGAVISKSISIDPIEGYRNPTVITLDNSSYINAVGLSNPGAEAFSNEISCNRQVPIIISLVGTSDVEFPHLLKKFNHLNIAGYEINLSCPHVAKMGMEVGDDPEMVGHIVKAVKSNTSKPVIIKVGVGSADIMKIAEAAVDSGANAITAINTIRAMTINIETGMPVLSNKIGGLSGKSIKHIAIRCVYEISKNLKIPVIGCGGIFTWQDAVEFLLAGASALQLGSVIGSQGLSAFRNISYGIMDYLKKKDFKKVTEIVGLAHRY
ncbi:MAG TPA: dihydroorotate dehydrogenase [Nitrososphaeraceae archaeon]|jgi:dihydroorotate dehydrogenase (NAD+) catalytic subunit|nr:dihydroorotate dehydrogenase [Nitrososphaeraceae archaeon]